MARTFKPSFSGPTRRGPVYRITWRERAFVLGGPGIALVYTTVSFALGANAAHVGPLWMAAIAWTVVASLAGALNRGLRHRDWSAFRAHQLPEDDGEIDEWSSRTGRYSYLGDLEDRMLRDDEHLR